ncbi:DNA photolyase [Salpingoeca rosetta]|uniref:DNA photolyase n=1 Tax=Salpingoeca rosetta (strain ATCC 50818 / BSB-021) TaxID=946362 RepID=F2U6L6_SALR5|nr:DNA photolyase [Salpingoeca rosetta]EGD83498.1 DNA photolyase [Salpingoeca rosetta]|eukprot:XP_004995002.1 DNA photolyase [Salpingoeca rosetta]
MSGGAVSIHWFRKGLRLHDNAALLAALKGAKQVYPVFVLDPHFAKPEFVGVVRYNFLLESLRDLDKSLRTLGSRLYVLKGKPLQALEEKFKEWEVTRLTFERDTEPYAKLRDTQARELAEKHGIEVITTVGHTLHDPEQYIAKAGGADKIPLTYSSFGTLFRRLGKVPAALSAPTKEDFPQSSTLVRTDALDDHRFDVPSLKDMGYEWNDDEHEVRFPGGETEALERMRRHLQRKAWIAHFEKPKTSPNTLEPSTTGLSPYLKFGCLSPRLFYHELARVYAEYRDHAKPPVSLHGQLLWREFFHMCGYAVKNFDRMEGNRICRQIDWDTNDALLAAWENARTGYPWIDACMTQLRREGWLHHLARHAVACFLTRGDLYQSWEKGAQVFDRLLVDADWHLNSANWMWLSCSSFFYQYFRVYSPVAFGKKTDPSGAYIRKYLPQLKAFPDKYIYEPWKAPPGVQRSCGCIIGKDYPEPIVDHAEVSAANKARIRACYDALKQAEKAKKTTTKDAKSSGGASKRSSAQSSAKLKKTKTASSKR